MSLLNHVMIQSPCTANWDEMTGNEQARHCGQCNLNVYHLSAMTTQQAEALLTQNSGGRLCVRYYQRPDGTMMTTDCNAVRASHQRKARLLSSLGVGKTIAATVLFVTLVGSLTVQQSFAETPTHPAAMGDAITVEAKAVGPLPVHPEPPSVIMGGIHPMEPPMAALDPVPVKPLVPCKTKGKSKIKKSPNTKDHQPPVVMGKMALPQP